MSDPFAPVRHHLARRRLAMRLTQPALAEYAGVEVDLIKDLETRRRSVTIPGDGRTPRNWADFARICEELGEDPVELLRRYGLLEPHRRGPT